MKYDIIIIGAGAAGLMAMKDLLHAGYRVCLLEAASAAGGRIATITEKGFEQPVETGAEFIHGELPLTLSLLKEAGIQYVPVKGKMISVQNKDWRKNEAHEKHWPEFIHKLDKLKEDVNIAQFLDQHFADPRYEGLRKSVRGYAEGFDLSDITSASAMAALHEWNEDDHTQYRIPGGYSLLINDLISQCFHNNGAIYFDAVAETIQYNTASVHVRTKDNRRFEAAKLLLTVSAGVLQSGDIEFVPAFGFHYAKAINNLGYGTVIKFLFQFSNPLWENKSDNIGFIVSDETIPTWWTQLSVENNLLTGWLGGPSAMAKSNETEKNLFQSAIISLSNIFQLSPAHIRMQVLHYKIICWQNHPFIKGGYSYNTVAFAQSKKILSHPVKETIFFAGEAMYNGASQGTVEAALQSGRDAAKKIKESFSAVKK